MNVTVAARAHNQRSVELKWHQFCDPTLAFADPSYEQLLTLWRSKAGDRKMPSRSEITPRDLKEILRHIVLFERVDMNPSVYRWRLVGTAITNVAGHLTGKTFEESAPPDRAKCWTEAANLMFEVGKPLRFLGRVHISGREYLKAENLYVPLANDNDVPTFMMGLCRYTPRSGEDDESWENELASFPGGLL